MLLKDIAGEITHVIGVKNYEKVFKPKSDENYEAFLFFKNGLTVSMQSLNIKDYDILIQNDGLNYKTHILCCGFFYVKSNKKTVLYKQ